MLNLGQSRLVDILPPSINQDDQVVTAAAAIDQLIYQQQAAIDRLAILARLDGINDQEADELAWQFHVDFYGPPMPLEKKRELVKKSLVWHRKKGTPSAVEEVVSAAFDSAEVKEWFDYGGQPYHFKVVTREILTPEKYDQVVRAINSVKRKSAVLDDIEVNRDYNGTLEISSSYNAFSFPYMAFASETLYAGTKYDGPAVVNIPPNPVYTGTLEPTNDYEAKLQAPYAVTGLVYAGNSGVAIPPIKKPDDQAAAFSSSMETSAAYTVKTKGYKATGTIFAGLEEWM